MHGMKSIRRFGVAAALFAAGIKLAGCATTFNHSFDPATSYTGLKSYGWATGSAGPTQDLVVKNVQYHADQVLEKKGFRKTAESPDMLVTISYENEMGVNQYG